MHLIKIEFLYENWTRQNNLYFCDNQLGVVAITTIFLSKLM